MSYFDYIIATKLFGQGSGEQKEEVELNVTENGTYNAPDGQTYNPVNVNVSATVEKPYMTYTVNAQNLITGVKLYSDNEVPQYVCNGFQWLENVDLSGCANATNIPYGAFQGCVALSTILSFPNHVTNISSYAFKNCYRLTLTELPSSLTTIDSNAFESCQSLVLTELPSNLTTIGGAAFSHCTGLTSIKFPSRLLSIGNLAFHNCTGLTSIKFPSRLLSIGNAAFMNCTGLTSVTFSARPTELLYPATFSSCSNLLDIYVPWAEGEVDYAPWGATNATIHYNWTEA